MVGLAAPAVGPAPASRDASSFVIFSISVVHCPAAAVPMGKATKAQAPSSKVVVFMALLPVASESRVCGFPPFNMNQDSKRTFRAAHREFFVCRAHFGRIDEVKRIRTRDLAVQSGRHDPRRGSAGDGCH